MIYRDKEMLHATLNIYIFGLKVTAMRHCGAGLSEIDQVGAIHILSTFSGAASLINLLLGMLNRK